MPSLRQLRRRIRSVENTAKVTNAMQLIAGSKMRRAQQLVLAGRPYAEKLAQVIADLEAQPREESGGHPLLDRRQVNRIQVLHLTPDRGLCGGLHGNMNRRVAQFILEKRPTPVSIIAVGRKGRDFMARSRQDLQAAFVNIGDRPAIKDILPISQLILKNYMEGQADEVYLAYPKFISLVSQQPEIVKLLPVDPAELPAESKVGYIYEPNPAAVLNALLPRFVEMEIYHAMLELSASEQSARMVAMRNATDNANELVDELTLDLNKVRQNAITSEILDIIGGAMALRS
ncbi:MAG: ATP synthase F1 subunit gamma [SAR202 cluster bacterium]|nr:ATP synthase F1 subunit gamma [SAR202 cluster bacterium]